MLSLSDFLSQWRDASPTILVHTSGSTGRPKPMRVEKRRMMASARITCDFLSLHPGDTALLCMPLDYIAGKMVVVRALERGMKLVAVNPSGHPLASVDSHIDFAAMVPLQVYNSLRVPLERERLMRIGQLLIGGGAVDAALERGLRDFPGAAWSTYGMTETLSHIALRRLNGPAASQWYTPFDGVGIGVDSRGCLTIDAPMVHEGRLTTHDRVELRQDPVSGRTQFRVLGRLDNVIDSGGIKIQIEEVEQSLRPFLRHPFVITQVPDAKYGEAVTLLTEATDIAEVEEICMNSLPKYWHPRHIFHVGRLPLTATGKPARAEAAQLALRLLQAHSQPEP